MGILPGLVRLDLSIGGGLDGDGEEVVGVVSFEMEKPGLVKIDHAPMPCTNTMHHPCTDP